MHGFELIVAVLLPIVVISLLLAALKWCTVRTRVVALSIHLALSIALVLALEGPPAMWLMVFFPGMCLALIRLIVGIEHLRKQGHDKRGE